MSSGDASREERAVARVQALAMQLCHSHPTPAGGAYVDSLKTCREALLSFVSEANCAPILVRTAWHDAGTYDPRRPGPWPAAGGANGSIRFEQELAHGANAGLPKGIRYLQPFKKDYPQISWADLIQLAGACAIEAVGGPRIPMKYGRLDTEGPLQCPPEGALPAAAAPFEDGAPDAASHLRNVFYRMGFDDQEIVALSGAHTIGRAFKERSGTVTNGYGEASATKFTCPMANVRHDGAQGVGMAGGKSWTKRWLTFDNSYFQREYAAEPELLWLETDAALHNDTRFAPHFARYAADQRAFFRDFAAVFAKLSERGSKFDPPEGIRIDCPHMLRHALEQVPTVPALVCPKVDQSSAPGQYVSGSVPSSTKLTMSEIKKHTKDGDCWVVIRGKVYDVSNFLNDHPGGKKTLLMGSGKDATEEFEMLHPPNVLKKYAQHIRCLGDVV